MTQPRLLYLGFAFPPGVQALHPHLNPAGHRFEVEMAAELRKYFEFRSVGVLPIPAPRVLRESDPGSGMDHHLVLEDRPPHLFHRYRSLLRLKREYRLWLQSGWQPDAVLSYNLSPIYNAFLLGIGRLQRRPRLILMLLDSSQLGRPLPWGKRLRYRFKPLVIPDVEMLRRFDGCVGLSRDVEEYLNAFHVPFLWMPGACSPSRCRPPGDTPDAGTAASDPIRFGYFGALAEHAGILEFAKAFLSISLPNTFHVCGYGKLSTDLARLAEQEPRLQFRGLLPSPEDCLRLGQSCDVLVNPRPATHGNQNNFPSKLFEYALCGRAILSSRLSGADAVLGDNASYFDPHDFDRSVREALTALAGTSRKELRARGRAIQTKILSEFTWPKQGARISEFIRRLTSTKSGRWSEKHVGPGG